MNTTRTTQHVTIAQSGQVSGDISLAGAWPIAIFAPALTSCKLILQGNFDTTSANFLPLWKPDGTGEYSWNIGLGSASLVLTDRVWPMAHLRIKSSVPQDDVRSFAVLTR